VKGYRRSEWQKTRERNEALDCRVYARAAAVYGMDRATEEVWQALEEQLAALARDGGQPPKAAQPPQGPIRARWFDPDETKDWFRR
jgi:phage terminase large subunit GpA-like protein